MPTPCAAKFRKLLSLAREGGGHGAFHRVLPSRSFPRLGLKRQQASAAFSRDWLPCTCVALLRKQLADKEALPLAEPTYSHLHSPDSAAVPLPRGGAINPRPRRRRRRRRRRTRDVALREVGSAGHPCAAFSLLVLNISFRERDLTLAPSAPPRGRPL